MSNLQTEPGDGIVLIAQYFGPLPAYFRAWLTSCQHNPGIHWVFVTDQPLDGYEVPRNVQPHRRSLEDMKAMFDARFKRSVTLHEPYKICDFRPFFWMLLDDLGLSFDYWGHCDIDVVFGRLRTFLEPAIRAGCERLFELGCLSIYRNSALAKSMAFSPAAGPGWEAAISSRKCLGFDEHTGVNRAWAECSGLWHRTPQAIFDIEPRVLPLASTSGTLLPARTRLFWRSGRLFAAEHRAGQRICQRELMLAHFQKRPLKIPVELDLSNGFEICPSSLAPLPEVDPPGYMSGSVSDGVSFTLSERLFLAQNCIRKSHLVASARSLHSAQP